MRAGIKTTASPNFEDIESEWLALWQRDPRATVFNHPAWHASYIAAFPHVLPLLLVQRTDDGTPLAIWPLERRDRSIGFLSMPFGDYLRPVMAVDVDAAMLVNEALRFFTDAAPRHRLELHHLRSDDPLADLLAKHAASHGYMHVITEGDLCLRLSLAVEPDGFEKRVLGSRGRSRALRKLKDHGEYHFERFEDRESALMALPDLFSLHTRRWFENGSPFMAESGARRFCTELVRRLPEEMLYAARLDLDGRPIAFDFHFMYRQTLGHWTSVYHRKYADLSPGFVMLCALVERLAQSGFTCLDFLRGPERYKERFSNTSGANRSALLFRSKVARTIHVTAQTAKPMVETWLSARPRLRQRVRLVRSALAKYGAVETGRRVIRQSIAGLRDRLAPPSLLMYEAAAMGKPHELQPELSFRRGTAADVFAVVDMIDPIRKPVRIIQMLDRLENGDELIIGSYKGELAFAGWLTRGPTADLPEVGCRIALDADSVYIYDCYTSSLHRGLGIYPAALKTVLGQLRSGERALIGCMSGNVASRKGVVRAGFLLTRHYTKRGAPRAQREHVETASRTRDE
jgi:CelD/BcsL family acetyltransferase involved in cellulose biosynthesis